MTFEGLQLGSVSEVLGGDFAFDYMITQDLAKFLSIRPECIFVGLGKVSKSLIVRGKQRYGTFVFEGVVQVIGLAETVQKGRKSAHFVIFEGVDYVFGFSFKALFRLILDGFSGKTFMSFTVVFFSISRVDADTERQRQHDQSTDDSFLLLHIQPPFFLPDATLCQLLQGRPEIIAYLYNQHGSHCYGCGAPKSPTISEVWAEMKQLVGLFCEFFAAIWKDLTDAFNPRAWRDAAGELRGMDRQKVFRNAKFILPQLLLFYTILSPVVAMPLYDKLLFHPLKCDDGGYQPAGKVQRQDLHILVAPKYQISAWYYKLDNAKGTVLLSHGNGGNMAHRNPIYYALLEQGYSVLTYDYEGYGRSDGSPTIPNCCRDGLAVYDFLEHALKEKPEKIVLYGESLGGGISAQIAKDKVCRGLILQSSFYSLPDLASTKFVYMRLYPRLLFPKNSLETNKVVSAKDFSIPVCLITGTEDRVIPETQSEKLFKIIKGKKQMFKVDGAGHNDLQDEEFYKKYRECLGQALAFFD